MSDLKLKLDGTEYELLQPDDMTMGEQWDFEDIAGCGVDRIEDLDENYSSKVVGAWMCVSIHRAKPDVRMKEIVDRIRELKPEDMKEAWENVVGQSPPSVEPNSSTTDESEQTTERSSLPSSEIDQESEIPSGTGVPSLAPLESESLRSIG